MVDVHSRTSTTALRLLVAIVLVFAAACRRGGDDDDALPATTSSGASSTAGTDAGAGDGGGLDEQMPLPPGLEGQLAAYSGGDLWGCGIGVPPDELPSPTTPSFFTNETYIGTTTPLCGVGFEPGVPMSLAVIDPNGAAHTLQVEESTSTFADGAGWSSAFFPEPGSPTGEYRVQSTQNGVTTENTFVVALAIGPKLIISTGQAVPDRTPARIDLHGERVANVFVVGFPPGSDVRVFLYRVEADDTRAFRRELPSITTDDRGEGTLELEVDPDTPPGTYCVAFLEQLSGPDQITHDPCYRPGAIHQELLVSGGNVLQRGASGDAVALLQRKLANRGYDVAVDGVFGPGTEEAVRQFQSDQGLEVDGIAGPETLGALGLAA